MASFALGGLYGCGDLAESDNGWVPAVEAPPGIVPGLPNRYATTSLAGGAGLGLVVEHRMGRPVKVEGNPLHPASLGATDALAQALLLDFYDPDRAAGMLREGQPATVGDLLDVLLPARASLFASHGAGLRVLTGACVSPRPWARRWTRCWRGCRERAGTSGKRTGATRRATARCRPMGSRCSPRRGSTPSRSRRSRHEAASRAADACVAAGRLRRRDQPAEAAPYRAAAVGPGKVPPGRIEANQRPASLPPLTAALLQRGQDQFRQFCTPCHSELGDGHGMVVQRGFFPPPSYHDARLRQAPTQHFYDVITGGYGAMYPFADWVRPADRWAIAACIRALQRSTGATPADLTMAEREALP